MRRAIISNLIATWLMADLFRTSLSVVENACPSNAYDKLGVDPGFAYVMTEKKKAGSPAFPLMAKIN